MPLFRFAHEPSSIHRASSTAGAMLVDGVRVPLHVHGKGAFRARVDGRNERLHAVAHGDAIHVQMRGRVFRLERVDAARSAAGAGNAEAGKVVAPMPGVLVALQVELGRTVRPGEALLVIESMKLQMTIAAATAGIVAELPVAVGQTFQRGAVLVVVTGAKVVP